jgi:hypothetical protein
MEHDIDLLIMPLHCSHKLQPLNVGVFSAFKPYHSVKTHALSWLSSQRIPCSQRIEILSKARKKAMTKENLLAGWRGFWLVASGAHARPMVPSQSLTSTNYSSCYTIYYNQFGPLIATELSSRSS